MKVSRLLSSGGRSGCCSRAGCGVNRCGCGYQSCCSCSRDCAFQLKWARVNPDRVYPVSAEPKEPYKVEPCDVEAVHFSQARA